MKCSCPKCHAQIELDLPAVDESGTPGVCPACSAQFVVHRESFGARVLRRSGQISCAACGNLLGPQTFCPSCGVRFPDYVVLSLGRKPLTRATSVKLKSSPFAAAPNLRDKLPVIQTAGTRPSGKAEPAPDKKPVGKHQKTLVLVACISVALLLAASGGWALYLMNKGTKEYTQNFVRAAFCMQSGSERSLKACGKLTEEWKSRMAAGQTTAPRLRDEDQRALKTIKAQTDKFMQQLNKPPKKYRQATEKLNKLYDSYQKVGALPLDPGTSVTAFVDATAKASAEYKAVGRELKAGIPAELVDELREGSKRHQSLRGLFE